MCKGIGKSRICKRLQEENWEIVLCDAAPCEDGPTGHKSKAVWQRWLVPRSLKASLFAIFFVRRPSSLGPENTVGFVRLTAQQNRPTPFMQH